MSDYKVTHAHNSMENFQKKFNGDCQVQSKLINKASYEFAVAFTSLISYSFIDVIYL
jgi:hypothetical protein